MLEVSFAIAIVIGIIVVETIIIFKRSEDKYNKRRRK